MPGQADAPAFIQDARISPYLCSSRPCRIYTVVTQPPIVGATVATSLACTASTRLTSSQLSHGVQQDYLPLEDFGAGGGWTGTDYLPLLTGDSFDSGLLPPGKGKERSSSNDMDHEASDLSSLDDGGEESGHEHDAADGTAPPPAATQPRKKSKSEADKTKARLGGGWWRVGQRRWGRGEEMEEKEEGGG